MMEEEITAVQTVRFISSQILSWLVSSQPSEQLANRMGVNLPHFPRSDLGVQENSMSLHNSGECRTKQSLLSQHRVSIQVHEISRLI